MNKTKHGMLILLEKNVEVLAGETISRKVMEGSEEITEMTDKRKMAEWVECAMERLTDRSAATLRRQVVL